MRFIEDTFGELCKMKNQWGIYTRWAWDFDDTADLAQDTWDEFCKLYPELKNNMEEVLEFLFLSKEDAEKFFEWFKDEDESGVYVCLYDANGNVITENT